MYTPGRMRGSFSQSQSQIAWANDSIHTLATAGPFAATHDARRHASSGWEHRGYWTAEVRWSDLPYSASPP